MQIPHDGSTVRITHEEMLALHADGSLADERTPVLVVLEGQARGASVRLGVQPIVLGRSSPADVVLPDARVSRSHCEVQVIAGQVLVTDHGSTNGSFVSGTRVVGTVALRAGATLQVGDHLLAVNLWSESELAAWHAAEQASRAAADLRIEIDERERREEVGRIVGSRYFRDIAAEVERLRASDSSA